MTEREQSLQRQDRLRRKPTAKEVDAKKSVSDIDLVISKKGIVTLYKRSTNRTKLVGVIQDEKELQSILRAASVSELRFQILLA